jgi:type I restriction enzyme S subunit
MKLSEYYLENSKNGLSKTFKDSDEGVRIVNMKELFGYNPITDSVEMRQVLLTNSELDRFGLKYNDLLFGRRSLMYEGSGKTTIYKGSLPTVFESSIIRVRLDEEKLNPDFANYYFNSKVGRGNVLSIVTGAAVFGIRGSDLSNLKVNFPILDTQKKIASILSAYDDLIENNNQRIKLLEEMAEEIYKEWFVRFRFPGYKEATFLDKEGNNVAHGTKGAIPVGWEHGTIGDLIEIKKGKNITLSTITEGNVPVVAGGLTPAYYHNKPNTKSPTITVSASGANSGFVNLYYEDIWASDCSFIDTEMTDILFFLYSTLRVRQKEVYHLQRGSAQPHVYPKDIMSLKIKYPKEILLNQFEELIKPFYQEIGILKNKNQILQETRDLLLPRLISGKLSVEDLKIED